MAEKLYYSMGEVAEMFDVRPSLLRHWESQFAVLRPKRNKKGNRLFTPQDVENLKLIYHLVKERGMTLDGARKALRSRRADKGVSRDAELMERLQRIRALLLEVREDLKADEGEVVAVADDFAAEEPSVTPVAAHTPVPSGTCCGGGACRNGRGACDGTRVGRTRTGGRRPRRGKWPVRSLRRKSRGPTRKQARKPVRKPRLWKLWLRMPRLRMARLRRLRPPRRLTRSVRLRRAAARPW